MAIPHAYPGMPVDLRAGEGTLSETRTTAPQELPASGHRRRFRRGNPGGRSPTSCFPPESTGAMSWARWTASTCDTGWSMTGSAWRALTCRRACRTGALADSPEHEV